MDKKLAKMVLAALAQQKLDALAKEEKAVLKDYRAAVDEKKSEQIKKDIYGDEKPGSAGGK